MYGALASSNPDFGVNQTVENTSYAAMQNFPAVDDFLICL